jgi:hypothetical protein
LVGVQGRLSCTVAITCMIATSAAAADQAIFPAPPPLAARAVLGQVKERPIPPVQMEFAARFWFGSAKTAKNLYAPPSFSNALASRLTYSGLQTYSGELYGRVAHWNGLFVKGYVGGGIINGGHLQDEDFPPIFFRFHLLSAMRIRARRATRETVPWFMPMWTRDTT